MGALEEIANRFLSQRPAVDYWTLRLVAEECERLAVRQGVVEPSRLDLGLGAMITVVVAGGVGYGATSDLSAEGLRAATERAIGWARQHARLGLFDAGLYPRSDFEGEYHSAVGQAWEALGTTEKLSLLQKACAAAEIDARIVDSVAWLTHERVEQRLITSAGGRVRQVLEMVEPGVAAVANTGSQTQTRRSGFDSCRQGGLERLWSLGLRDEAQRVAEEALALLDAPECPTGVMDLVLLPGQMMLQIHESIGHPLELDRILGDERNYAGTSFVIPEMFGRYRYGSELLNVTFDPTVNGELASYAADDEGCAAERAYLIRGGILERPLGGRLSQARSGLPGVANARACGWDRPAIDRMANINLEPGDSTLEALIAGIERGVLMDTNRSWSIDDSRNKFQFGCELGQLIVDGERKGLVRNPGYRGISASFWRSLDGVGDATTQEICGLHNCGKGEPNQAISVGHASPPCRFRDVAVFGGGS